MLPIHTILHPTDFSDRSSAAFHLACALARDHGARMLVLHVGQAPAVALEGVVVPLDPEPYERAVRARLEAIQSTDPEVPLERRLVMGDATAAEIIRVAQESDCDLIVMGTHGRTGLGRVLLGSVAELVLRRAPCPVLTVKTPFHAEVPAEERAAVAATPV